MDLIDRSNLQRIRISGYFKDRLLEEVIGVLNDAIQKAPTVDAVPRHDYDALMKRFRHLLESDFIRSFDEYDPKTGTYKRDISEADTMARVIRCENCKRSTTVKFGDGCTTFYCFLWSRPVELSDFCSRAILKPKVEA